MEYIPQALRTLLLATQPQDPQASTDRPGQYRVPLRCSPQEVYRTAHPPGHLSFLRHDTSCLGRARILLSGPQQGLGGHVLASAADSEKDSRKE